MVFAKKGLYSRYTLCNLHSLCILCLPSVAKLCPILVGVLIHLILTWISEMSWTLQPQAVSSPATASQVGIRLLTNFMSTLQKPAVSGLLLQWFYILTFICSLDSFCNSFPQHCKFWTLIKSKGICFALTNCNYPKCGDPFNYYVSGPTGCPPSG